MVAVIECQQDRHAGSALNAAFPAAVELSPEVADGPRSVILDQVQNGVAVRMAILYLLAGGGGDGAEARA